MSSPQETQIFPVERVERLIHLARGEKVLLDVDLATLYGVETRTLNQAVKRNLSRFPSDFMFQLTQKEADIFLRSRSQSVTLKRGRNIKYLPYAFTEQGVAMLSSVLRSERAVQVNVAIMRAFVSLRRILAGTMRWPPSSPNWNVGLKVTTKASGHSSTPSANSWHHPPSRTVKSAFTPSAGKKLTKAKPNPNANENRRTRKTLLTQFPFQGSKEPVQEAGVVTSKRPRIVSATEEHLPTISELAGVIWRACYPGIIAHAQIDYMLARMYSLDVLRDEIRSQGIRYDLLLVDGKPARFASHGPTPEPGVMKLHKLYLLPELHGCGLGSRLLQHCEQEVRAAGAHRLLLSVNKRNAKAIAAYQRNGFTIAEAVVTDIGGGFVMDDFIMAKELT